MLSKGLVISCSSTRIAPSYGGWWLVVEDMELYGGRD